MVLVLGGDVLSGGKRQVEPQQQRCSRCGYTHTLCASGYAHTATPCKVGDPDGGVQWLRQSLG
jgi:hypothetical protein